MSANNHLERNNEVLPYCMESMLTNARYNSYPFHTISFQQILLNGERRRYLGVSTQHQRLPENKHSRGR